MIIKYIMRPSKSSAIGHKRTISSSEISQSGRSENQLDRNSEQRTARSGRKKTKSSKSQYEDEDVYVLINPPNRKEMVNQMDLPQKKSARQNTTGEVNEQEDNQYLDFPIYKGLGAWQPSTNSETCYTCNKRFYTFFTKRYNCQKCLQAFCGRCSIMRIMKHEKQVQKIRICQKCNETNNKYENEVKEKKAILNIQAKMEVDKAYQQSAFSMQKNVVNQVSKKTAPVSKEFAEQMEEVTDDEGLKRKGWKGIEDKLREVKQTQGLQAASQLLSKESKKIQNRFEQRRNMEEKFDLDRSHSILSKGLSRINRKQSSINQAPKVFLEDQREDQALLEPIEENKGSEIGQPDDNLSDDLEQQVDDILDDIREQVMEEFGIDREKWGGLLSQHVKEAILSVKPWSEQKDKIDIAEYVKIQLILHQDTSKSRYVNGLVIKKSIAHNRMRKEIQNPKILLLSNSLGIEKDEDEFFDINMQINHNDNFISIIMKKIELIKPSLIFIQKDASFKVIETLRDCNITLVTNVKKRVMQRLERLTQTFVCPRTVLLDQDFIPGKCEKFFMEPLTFQPIVNNQFEQSQTNFLNKALKTDDVKIQDNILTLEGCPPYLGCTIVLSGPDANELKIVKHAVKKMLRLSRQLILESEYLAFFKLKLPSFQIGGGEKKLPFLHQKHMERQFLIFKEVSFSKRGEANQKDDDDANSKGGKGELIQAVNQSEKEVQSRIQMICKSPQMKVVHFYQEKQGDISLESKLRELCKEFVNKCSDCDQFRFRHVVHFYHKNGYVEMKCRFTKDSDQNPESKKLRIKQSVDKPISIQCWCQICPKNQQINQKISRQLQELSFYSFLEQFFYNQEAVIHQDPSLLQAKRGGKQCNHPFHTSWKVIFQIDFLKIEFQYHPVEIYELDMVCFKTMRGSMQKRQIKEKVEQNISELLRQCEGTFVFILEVSADLKQCMTQIQSSQILKSESHQFAKGIIVQIKTYLDGFDQNVRDYQFQALDTLRLFECDHEFQINKVHKAIVSRVCDYLFILKTLYTQVFDEFLINISNKTFKERTKISKKDQAQLLLQLTRGGTERQLQNGRQLLDITKDLIPSDSVGMDIFEEAPDIENQSEIQRLMKLMDFEERLRQTKIVKDLLKMSPSIPDGFDMNCTNVNVDDFSTLICQALLSNDHFLGLKEQGYMSLDQKLDRYKHTYKYNLPKLPIQRKGTFGERIQSINQTEEESRQTVDPEVTKDEEWKIQKTDLRPEKLQRFQEEFLVLKENQDVFNREISQKEIETELLRLDHQHFAVFFNTYKSPQVQEMEIIQERGVKTIRVDRTVLSRQSVLDQLEKIYPVDLDQQFYFDLNKKIITQISTFWSLRDTNKQGDNLPKKDVSQSEKYSIHSILYPKYDIGVKMYFPSHFQALRKLYCGSFDSQLQDLFKSTYWTDNSGGKSKSQFYKSYNEKYVMKVISKSEMEMFSEFAQPYFEYMCRSFNQTCPTALCKVLGAFKLKISNLKKREYFYVILMENLVLGMNPNSSFLTKYDLKGSMSRRYVDAKGKPQVTKLDTNFLEDHNSQPICINYTLHRLMQIAIHNDTCFLSRHEKIDYSLLVWIDHEQKLIRIGIIDYIQRYNTLKQFEENLKKTLLSTGQKPTIINPESYKQRFKEAMNNYFLSILEDKPIGSFAETVQRQQDAKAKFIEEQENIEDEE